MPNPSGGRGHYIVPWSSLRSLFAPTLFDTLLMARFAEIGTIDPSTVRQAVLEVAREGTAGRIAASAAVAALAAETRGKNASHIALLRRLVQEVEPTGNPASTIDQAGDLQRRAQRALATLSTRLRLDSGSIMTTLEALAQQFGPIGVGERSLTARLPILLSSLAHVREELAAVDLSTDPGRLATPIAILIDTTLGNARTTLAEARGQAANLVELLIAWRADAATTQATLTRTEWLLDGWDRVCRVWFAEPSLAERLDALQDALPLIPVMPQEAAGWPGMTTVEHPVLAARTAVKYEDWRTGVGLLDVIARNEALLSLS